jgi:hypothetical protein
LRVAAALLAERERDAADRLTAALRACRDSAFFDAALCPSRLRAREVARERFADFLHLLALFPLRTSRAACSWVFFDANHNLTQRVVIRLGKNGKPINSPAILVTESIIDRVADRVFAFHQESRHGPDVDSLGSPTMVRRNWEENLAQTSTYVGRTITTATFDSIHRWVSHWLQVSGELLLARLEATGEFATDMVA